MLGALAEQGQIQVEEVRRAQAQGEEAQASREDYIIAWAKWS